MDLATLGLIVTAVGAIAALDNFAGAANRATRAGSATERMTGELRRGMAAMGFAFGVREMIEYADSWALINARIRLVTKSSDEAAAVQDILFRNAQASRTPFEATATLYTRVARNAETLGRSQNELIRFTDLVNKTMVTSGRTAQEATQGMIQLSQALGSGKLQGDEFRTVMESMPEVAKAIAAGMGVTTGALYKLRSEGKITSEIIIDSVLKMGGTIDAQFKAMPVTIGQAFTVLQNQAMRLVGSLSASTGAGASFAKMILSLAENLNKVVSAIAAAVIAWGVYNIAIRAAAAWTAIMAAVDTIRGIIALAKGVRSIADAAALLSIVGGGAVKILAVIAAMGLGFLAYKKLLSEMNDATAEWSGSLDSLDDKIGQVAVAEDELTKKERARLRVIAETRAELADMVRVAQQGVAASNLQGMAQEEQNIRNQSANELLRMRADLQEKVISATISQADADMLGAEAATSIAQAEGLRMQAMQNTAAVEARIHSTTRINQLMQEVQLAMTYGAAQQDLRIHYEAVNAAIEARRELTGEALRITLINIEAEEKLTMQLAKVQRLASQLGTTFADTFSRILSGGIEKFSDLFDSIKQMFLRMLAEMLAAQLMERLGSRMAAIISGIFSPRNLPVATATSPGGSTTDSVSASNASESSGGPVMAVKIEAIQVNAAKSWASQLAPYLAILASAFGMGQSVGGMTTNRGLGALGGSISGAATGAMMGSVIPGVGTAVGAVVGGIAGAIGGFLGSSKRHAEEIRKNREVLETNNRRLVELRESFSGSSSTRYLEGLETISNLQGRPEGIEEIMRSLMRSNRFDRLSAEERAVLTRMSEETGIRLLDDSGKIIAGALEQMREAIELTIRSITQFGNNLDDIQLQQEARRRLFPDEYPDTPQQNLEDTYDVLKQMAPDLLRQMGLSDLNLGSEIGRSQLVSGLQEIYRMIEAGLLTPELLGAFSDKGQLIEALLRTRDGLDAFNESLNQVTTDFPRAMDLLLWEQQYGRGASVQDPVQPEAPKTGPAPSGRDDIGSRNVTVHGDLVLQVVTNGGETDEQLVLKVERSALLLAGRGGETYLAGTTAETVIG